MNEFYQDPMGDIYQDYQVPEQTKPPLTSHQMLRAFFRFGLLSSISFTASVAARVIPAIAPGLALLGGGALLATSIFFVIKKGDDSLLMGAIAFAGIVGALAGVWDTLSSLPLQQFILPGAIVLLAISVLIAIERLITRRLRVRG